MRAVMDTNVLVAGLRSRRGAAYEVLKDTSSAAAAYNEAAALLDTIVYPKESKTIRENLARLTGSR